ncbi:amino acid ABC transporter permease [Lapillicoccus jejuensis]|uniref:Amino acid ABC transporter membrane protein 2 (PAAT family) n=1 Tax=Lapillicoccus jejuensis TaxID=402171 RepID=A0A542E659_9MICO|nr:ABC transporter permease subunit [Lapillicoccus jejuensis]TQJ10794.1 amino acid ABC transporter membrane protein 2 (PAAT family) [Lapillicoccus jejuensis]
MSTSALYDAPGPRARARHRLFSALGILVFLGILFLVVRKLQSAGQLQGYMWQPFLVDRAVWRDYLLPGLIGTFKAAAISIVLAGVLGLLLGVGRLSRVAPVRWVSSVVVEFFRSVPVLIMMLASYGIYSRSGVVAPDTAPLAGVVTGLTLYNGSVIAELVRSGVHSLPKGQREAGASIGLSEGQTLRIVLLPQALTAMLPALVGQLVVVLKDTALGYQITYQELLFWSKTLGSAFANPVAAYVVAAVIFIVVNYLLTLLAGRLERRLRSRGGRGAPGAPASAGTPGAGAAGTPAAQPATPSGAGVA